MRLILSLFLCSCFGLAAQGLKEFDTKIEYKFDFGIEVQNDWKKRDQLLKDLSANKKEWDNLTEEESMLFEKYDETFNSMWDIFGGGCSWYCGAGEYTVKTSSALKSQSNNVYYDSNLNDFTYKTAWVEGVEGYGIGEYIEFEFLPGHPRLTTIKIANGYVKSKKLWKDNSRVRTFKMYVNNKMYAIINLKDVYALQYIKLDSPLGNSNRDNLSDLEHLPKWKIKFEIVDVYKGDKYPDTAITEIFFDGIDVH